MSDGLARRLEELESELAALRAFETAPYRAIVEDMSELVVRWQPDGTRLFVNDAYCRLFGAQRSQLIGTSFWPLISVEDRERVRRRIEALSPEAPVTTGRHRALGPNGELIWMEWVDRALFDGDGHVVELQSVGRDISERVRYEQDARRVENADAVARISAAIAHDLNNLLFVIQTEIELLEERIGGSEETQNMSQALSSVVDLVRRLGGLRFGVVFKPVFVDLNVRVQRLQGLLGEVSGDAVTLTCRLAAAPCSIRCDPTQIDQVLVNLVKNAAEAMPGGGEIRIATRVDANGDGAAGAVDHSVVLEVSDRGRGISPNVLNRLFEPAVTTKPNGQGLGLATVKTIVDGHGGVVKVRSSSEGSTFEIAFPLATGR